MTLYYADIASFQAGINLTGLYAVCAKITQGTTYTNPYYKGFASQAKKIGAILVAYHFLEHGNASAQADYCYAHAGKTPLMLDVESYPQIGSYPTMTDVTTFIDHYRARGGVVHLLYLPKWYWETQWNSAPLEPLIARRMVLVSSHYTSYTDADSGPGWQPYGGMTPMIWQYSSTINFGGVSPVDFNAFRGTYPNKQDPASVMATITQFRYLINTGSIDPPIDPVLSEGDMGSAVVRLQKLLNAWGYGLAEDGDFGPLTLAAVEAFQERRGMALTGVVDTPVWNALAHWTYGPPGNLKIRAGHTNFHASWTVPANAPQTPTRYLVWVYEGLHADRKTLVKSYPRTEYQVFTHPDPGSLKRHTTYTVHVSASDAHGAHLGSYVYAEAQFTTG